MPVLGRPQRIISVSAALSSRVVRRLAPVGASSRSFSPSAKAPWHSGHPAPLQALSPAFTPASPCARLGAAQVKAITAISATAWRMRNSFFGFICGTRIPIFARALAWRLVNLDARRALEQVLGQPVLVRVDRVLAGFV